MNSLKKCEGIQLLNFEGDPGVSLLNFEGYPWVPLLNFEEGHRSQVPGSRVLGSQGTGPIFTPSDVFYFLIKLNL